MSKPRTPTEAASLTHVTEANFLNQVTEAATYLGWRTYHTWQSKHSAVGFPDLVMVRPPRVIFAELKSAKGKLTPPQRDWVRDLYDCTGVACYIWRPEDWDAIVAILVPTPHGTVIT